MNQLVLMWVAGVVGCLVILAAAVLDVWAHLDEAGDVNTDVRARLETTVIELISSRNELNSAISGIVSSKVAP